MNRISKQLIKIAREIQAASQYKLKDEKDLFPTKESFIKFLKEHDACFFAKISLKHGFMRIYLDIADDDAFTFLNDNRNSENILKYIDQLANIMKAKRVIDDSKASDHTIWSFVIEGLEKEFGIKTSLINSILDIIDHSKLHEKIEAKITEKIGDNIEGIPFVVNQLL